MKLVKAVMQQSQQFILQNKNCYIYSFKVKRSKVIFTNLEYKEVKIQNSKSDSELEKEQVKI